MPIAIGLFERYALGNISATQLEAETGLAATRIRMILINPLYNGWIRRHRGNSVPSSGCAPSASQYSSQTYRRSRQI